MGASPRHILSQGPVVSALVRTAVSAMKQRPTTTPETPGRTYEAQVAARPNALVDDYIRHCGGSPSWYKHTVPAHLFPQWGFPLLARTLDDIPYDLTKVLNGGCRIEVHRPLPRNEPLVLRARLQDIDDNGSRAVIKQQLVTGTASAPDAVTSTLYAIVPLKKKKGAKKAKKEPKRVPEAAREIARLRLAARSGWDFAVLTGDFNPIHWVGPYARAAGFKNTILHGFATLARAVESMNRSVWSGDPRWLKTVDVQFTKPLVLPAKPGVYLDRDTLAVGDAPGAPSFLLGTLTTETPSNV